MRRVTSIWAVVILVSCIAVIALADVPTSMNVQGRLTDATGKPLPPGAKQFTFKIFDEEIGGKEVWPGGSGEDQIILTDDEGLWNAHVGAIIPLIPKFIVDTSRWLEITVDDGPNPPETLPRVKLNTGPYVFRSASAQAADTAEVAEALVGGAAFLPLAGGTMTGPITNTGNPTITMGKANFGDANTNTGDQAFVAGSGNSADANHSTVSGGQDNTVNDAYGTIGGGSDNLVNGVNAVVAGGFGNEAAGNYSVIGGGRHAAALGKYAVVSGGGGDGFADSNAAVEDWSTVGGGRRSRALGVMSTVSGGWNNEASDSGATVAGGIGARVQGRLATVGGGRYNRAAGNYSVVAGGGGPSLADSNSASGILGSVGGGSSNRASGFASTISGGQSNTASAGWTSIGGGVSNSASAIYTTVGGGAQNEAMESNSCVGGGSENRAAGNHSFVGGGSQNRAAGDFSFVGGGGGHLSADSNNASGFASSIGGGSQNTTDGNHSTVGGGLSNAASDDYSAVGGGLDNQASDLYAGVGGGHGNTASGENSTVAGGQFNSATSQSSTVGGGNNNMAGYGAVCGGGFYNRARGSYSVVGGGGGINASDSNVASGIAATVPGGRHNRAAGDFSFAAGRSARANHDGTFVWADNNAADFGSLGTNQFLIRSSGGVGIGTLFPGGSALTVQDGALSSYDQMVQFSSYADPETGNDVLAVDVPASAPVDFQYIECQRLTDVDFRVWGDGDVTADGTITGGGADLAEMVAVSTGVQSVAPGDVMVIDPNNPRALTRSNSARSTLVAGVHSSAPGFIASEHDWDQIAAERGLVAKTEASQETASLPVMEVAAAIGEIPLAVVGIVPCRVSAENGAISPGDLLVTSSTPGHAMREVKPDAGTILGKALGTLQAGTGTIDVLVTLQ